MKKKLLKGVVILFSISAALGVAGCSSEKVQIDSEEIDIGNVAGESVETEEISAVCPEGWTSIAVQDATAEEPDTEATNELRFVKGGSDQEALLTNPYINIVYYGPDQEIMQVDPNEWYDNVENLQSFTTGEYEWNGYSGTSLGVPFVYLYSETDSYTLKVWLYTREGSELSASITDADVLAILKSIAFTE